MEIEDKKVAIVADWLTNQGGAERVIVALSKLFPEAPIFTSVYKPGSVPDLLGKDIRTTWLQKLPGKIRQKHQFLMPLLPEAFGKLDLSEFDIIISSSSAFAKSVKKSRVDQVHICYCHSPTRYLYHAREEYLESYPLPVWLRPLKFLQPKVFDYVTPKDLKAAEAVDHFISNSDFIGERIKEFYHRDSVTIHPCTETAIFANSVTQNKQSYFLAVGRFIPYKKFDLLVETFIQNGLPLKLAGIGPELARCKKIVSESGVKNIEFLEFVPFADLPRLYAEARAFLFPAEEDFGLTPVESMSSGTPVIALNSGGVKESVTDKTGVFFDQQTVASLQSGIDEFIKKEKDFDQDEIQARGENFSVEKFQQKLLKYISSI